ncbi:hypothetical protein INT08_02520 [Prosthecochloris sp. N3]|uniref:ABC transporter permease n=1 Tax=Prosthecochloris ethylica TaxID=2743976 RepID=A0ABR9XQH5_9CHLB|nr:hypothetical protein [Prosthecochloris ethylica]MBF0587250.1 hypothetical protein [Prosthecochloris ethylica]MBF0636056.1 hypothetical protein [Prosthecochloris ethylica]NUK48483.1 hypothetical protein [Prosthecochloris ethylica]
MLGKIFSFELRTRFSSPLAWLMLAMMCFQGVWYALSVYDFYVHDQTLINGAGVFYICLTGGGMILMIIIAMITGMSLYRDIEERTALFLYAFPIDEKRFFLGRFLGAYAINLLLVVAYVVGMIIIPYLGVGPADKFGPIPWAQLLHGYVLFGLTNIFLLTAISYFCVVQFRNMAASYIGIFLCVLIFLIAEAVSENSPYINALMILDPFGFVYTKEVVDGMTVAEKNSAFLPVDGRLLFNRLLWMVIGFVVFACSYIHFSFRDFIQAAFGSGKKAKTPFTQVSHDVSFHHVEVPHAKRLYSVGEYVRKLGRFALVEFLNVVRPVSFRVVLLVIAVMFFLYMILWNPVYYVGAQVPLTSGMVTTRLHTGFLMIILLMIWSGELFFRDRTTGFWQVSDAMPMPSWVALLSRFVAMCGVALIISLTMLGSGLVAQIGQGFFAIDWQVYIVDFLGFRFGWLTYVLYIGLVFFIAGLTANRFLTHVVCVGYFIFIVISFETGIIEQVRYGYALVPGLEDFSELNRYGIFLESSFWYFTLWLCLALPFLLIGIRFWNRGSEKEALKRLLALRAELGWGGVAVSLASLAMFFFLQSFLVAEVNTTRNYIPDDQADREAAEYEKRFGVMQSLASPRITSVDLLIDLFPDRQEAECRAEMMLVNTSDDPVHTLCVNADFFTEIRLLQMEGVELERLEKDKVLGMEVFALPVAMAPGDIRSIVFEYRKAYHGFTQGEPRAELAYNGLFMGRPVPVIGYDPDKELQENNERKAHGLDMLGSRMAPVDDPVSLARNFLASDAARVSGSITVGTPAPQTAFAPGILVTQWEESGRNYFRYVLEKPSAFHWFIGSARYAEKKLNIGQIRVTLLYKKEHDYNIDLYSEALENATNYLQSHLGAYPYKELRVAEIPFYQDPMYAFPNTIAISEKEGWYGDRENANVVSFIRFSVMKELFRHWVLEHGSLADVQGADMLWTALPDALALGFLEQTDGEVQTNAILDKKRRLYGKERGQEPNQEPPLLYADSVDYLEENKGTLALYHLSKMVGHKQFLRLVREWFGSRDNSPMVFRDFYRYLNERVRLDEKTKALFETVEQELQV